MRDEIKERIEAVKNGEVPGGYIKTEIGVLPEEWAVRPLSEISSVITDQAGEEELETLSISAGIGFVNQAQKFGKELSGKQYSKYTVLQKGDFAYNKGNSKRYPQGCTYMLREREKAAVPNVFECFRIREGVPEYYEQLFIHGFMNKQLSEKINHGVRDDGLLNLTDKDFYSTKVPFPSVREQRRIAEILDACDSVIKLKQELIEGKCKQKQILMARLLDPAEGSLDNERVLWTEVTLGSECLTFSGGTPSAGKEEFYKCGTIPFIRSAEIGARTTELYLTEAGFDNSAAKMVEPGDILYALYGANSGDCAISKIHGAINQAILCIRPKTIDKELLYYALCYRKDSIVSTYLQGGQGNLSAEIIKSITLKLPQNPDYIKGTICILQLLDRELEGLEEELVLWQQKKKALMQLLLTGIVRVNA